MTLAGMTKVEVALEATGTIEAQVATVREQLAQFPARTDDAGVYRDPAAVHGLLLASQAGLANALFVLRNTDWPRKADYEELP